ncbi:MAG: MOSC N-terminal beta barrel domain-containing protein [Thiotrichaceae bacterium]|nr:MOSC N-terminal beta barrel domain-containing protein [Thiotrichaceae bacterium]
MPPVIHSLHIYPIKSCQGIDLNSIELTDTGFKYDRHWMLVDKQGDFLSQRKFPAMAKIKTALTEKSLVVSTEGVLSTLEIPLQSNSSDKTRVKIWNDQCSATIVSSQASLWFSELLGVPCDLVFLADTEHRLVDPDYAKDKQRVGFADGFPLLILSRASADLLSNKLDEDIDINRFRANIIIDGCDAHEEDLWSKISVNNIDILLAKPCSRCVIPSINQQSAEKHSTLLKTLASYRRTEGKVFVGQNGLHQSNGTVSVGTPVLVTEK